MSEQEQQQTTQVDEVKDAADVQPEVATSDKPLTDDKVAESSEKTVTEESVQKDEPEVEQPESTESVQVAAEVTEQSEEVKDTKALEEEKVEENGKVEDKEVVEESQKSEANGDSTVERAEADVAGDETNGVQKRKAENGADAATEDEKSPKKAKVVDEADQTKVEETAA